MAELNITNIPAPRVPFVDERTGLMAREWYRFFLNLFVLTGSGNNPITLEELQLGPPNQPDLAELLIQINQNIAPQYEDQSGDFLATLDTAQLMSMMSQFANAEAAIQGAYLQPVVQTGTIANYNLDNSPTAGGIVYGTGPALAVSAAGTLGQVLTSGGAGAPTWATDGGGTVTTVSVVSANGLAGTVATATTTPAITLSTTVTGLLKGNGTAISAATSGTDFAPATSGTSILYGNGAGGFSNVTIGTGVAFAGGTLSATGSGGTVTSVTGTAPVVSSGGATPAISMAAATTSVNGYLTSTDWTTFNNKGSGTVTSVTGTAPVVSSGGAAPAISMAAATTSVDGYLTSTDWNTFNGKQPAGSYLVSGGALGTPSSGTVTNLTGTASININGTVGATTANTGAFTTLSASGTTTLTSASANQLVLTGGTTVETRLKMIRGADDADQFLMAGWGGFVMERTGQAVSAVQPFTITMRGTTDVVPISVNYTGLAVTGSLSATTTATIGTDTGTIDTQSLTLRRGTGSGNQFATLVCNGAGLSLSSSSGLTTIQSVGEFSSSGLAVTGTLIATGNVLVGGTGAADINANGGFYVNPNSRNTFTVTSHLSGASSGSPYAYFYYANSDIGSITQTGTTGVLYNVTSDYRLKTVVSAVTGQGARIDALQPIEYTWNSNGSHTRGFLAHEFQEVYASSVTGTKDAVDKDGNPVYQAMQAATSEVIADLVAEIQSLRKRIFALETK